MKLSTTLLLAPILTILPPIHASHGMNLNCRGAKQCRYPDPFQTQPKHHKYAKTLQTYINELDDDTDVPSQHLIACTGPICARLNPPCRDTHSTAHYTLKGMEVKQLAWHIVHHGCKRCGQVIVGGPKPVEDEFPITIPTPWWLIKWLTKHNQPIKEECMGSLKFDWVDEGWRRDGCKAGEGLCIDMWPSEEGEGIGEGKGEVGRKETFDGDEEEDWEKYEDEEYGKEHELGAGCVDACQMVDSDELPDCILRCSGLTQQDDDDDDDVELAKTLDEAEPKEKDSEVGCEDACRLTEPDDLSSCTLRCKKLKDEETKKKDPGIGCEDACRMTDPDNLAGCIVQCNKFKEKKGDDGIERVKI